MRKREVDVPDRLSGSFRAVIFAVNNNVQNAGPNP